MKKLMASSIVLLALQASLPANAEKGISVYCDRAFSESQHSVTVDNIVGIAQHRQVFLQIEQKSNNVCHPAHQPGRVLSLAYRWRQPRLQPATTGRRLVFERCGWTRR